MQYQRSERLTYESDVFMMIPIDPWSLSLRLKSSNISITGICAIFDLGALDQSMTKEDLDALLVLEEKFKLQLESTYEHLESPTLNAQLVRKTTLGKYLQLAFRFDKTPENLLNLISEFAQNQPERHV